MKTLLSLLCLSSTSYASGFLVGQTGSMMGLASVGAGYEYDVIQTSLSAGYTPYALAGEDLFGITPRVDIGANVTVGESKFRLFLGTGVLFSLDEDTFIQNPDKYPDGYYPPTGMMVAPYAGVEYQYQKHGWFAEITTNDFYMELYLRNRRYLSLSDVTTYGIGYKFYL
jgi:hypothetical protein